MRKPHAAARLALKGDDRQQDDQAQTDREKNTHVLFRKLSGVQQAEWLKRLAALLARET